jgi:hypothetical protein
MIAIFGYSDHFSAKQNGVFLQTNVIMSFFSAYINGCTFRQKCQFFPYVSVIGSIFTETPLL